jgi:flagellar hook-length control protein FliK
LVNALLLGDTLGSAIVKPAASAAAPETKTDGGDAQAAPDAQAPAANSPPALFAGLNLAGLNLAVVNPIVAPAAAPNLPPVAVITPAAAKGSAPPTSPSDAATVAALQNDLPAPTPPPVSVTTIATAATATLELNSLVPTVSVSEKPGPPAEPKATIPQTVNGDGGLKPQSKDVSAVTQVAAVLPVTSNNSDNSQTAQQPVSPPPPLSNGEQPQLPISSTVTTGVTAVAQTPPQNAPAATPASSDPFSSTSAITGTPAVDTPVLAATVSAKAGAAPPADNGNSTPAAPQSVTASADAAIFAAAPAALQVHAGLFTGGQPAGNNPGFNPAQIIEQVAYALQVGHAGGQEMQLQLSPPDLGSLQINVSVHDGVLSARLEAQSPTTQQILVDNLSQLKNSLTQQGVAFDRIDVRLAGSQTGSSSSGSAESSFAQQQQGAYSWEQNPVFDPTETDAPPSVSPQTPRSFSRIAATSLDVTV